MIKKLDEFMEEVQDTCKTMSWKKDWSHGGCYIHLEVSEFIEALRGKGDPIDELGDVLFTLFSVAGHYNLDPMEAIEMSCKKQARMISEMFNKKVLLNKSS